MIHELKTEPEYFEAALRGEKTFEVRKDDRNFQTGDYLALNEHSREEETYTGRSLLVEVVYVLKDPEYCKEGYATMSIRRCRVETEGEMLDRMGKVLL